VILETDDLPQQDSPVNGMKWMRLIMQATPTNFEAANLDVQNNLSPAHAKCSCEKLSRWGTANTMGNALRESVVVDSAMRDEVKISAAAPSTRQ